MKSLLLLLLVSVLLPACTETTFSKITLGKVAVVAGDFDFIEETLDAEGVAYTLYDGYIDQPFYDFDPDYAWWAIANQVEDLLTSRPQLMGYNSLFLNCGMRGLGDRQYNGVDDDSQLVRDPEVLANIKEFVEFGGALYASDWAYDLIEAIWPDRVDFWGDDSHLDAAQMGLPPDPLLEDNYVPVNARTATIVDPELLRDMDRTLGVDDSIRIVFDVDSWATMMPFPLVTVGDASRRVLVEGDVLVRDPEQADGVSPVLAAPLMISFEIGDHGGKVVYSSFHNNPQVTADVREILRHIILGFDRSTV